MSATNLSKYKEDLKELLDTGTLMDQNLIYQTYSPVEIKKLDVEKQKTIKQLSNFFESKYQSWYTEAIAVIRQLIPDRLSEFIEFYKGDNKRKDVRPTTYNIQDWLRGARTVEDMFTGKKPFDELAVVAMNFKVQREILKSAERRFESSLLDIKQMVQADFFDSELEVSKELSKKGFYRVGGVLCGVIIEKHLEQVCNNHSISLKKNPTIAFLNEALKAADVIDIPTWRFMQRLGDIRNLCSHNSEREPTKEEVNELIQGTDKVMKTIY